MAHAFFLGVDVSPGEEDGTHDLTHALLEKSEDDSNGAVTYRLHHIRRHRRVDSAAEVADHLQGLVAEQPYIGRTSIIINRKEDEGQMLVEALQGRGLDPVAATLTEGSGTTAGETDEIGVHLGGVDVVQVLANLYRDNTLDFGSPSTELASRFVRDVQGLAEALDEADGNAEILGAESKGPSFDPGATHVTSAALAAWLATEWSFDPSQHLKESPQTDTSSRGGGAA